MANEGRTWIMYGVDENDPYCIHTAEQLIEYINEIGFLPLFKNEIPGFSVEERTVAHYWWSGDRERDPWEWREIIAKSEKVAYGKFFNKKAGFISLEWLSYFANFRRGGYDFDALWDDAKANIRQKKIMDLFLNGEELLSSEIKRMAGFGKTGEKNFEGIITELQMQMYLCVRDFHRKRNKAGFNYGWPVAVYTTPEYLWGYELVTDAYSEKPSESAKRIYDYMKNQYPIATDKQIKKVLGISV